MTSFFLSIEDSVLFLIAGCFLCTLLMFVFCIELSIRYKTLKKKIDTLEDYLNESLDCLDEKINEAFD